MVCPNPIKNSIFIIKLESTQLQTPPSMIRFERIRRGDWCWSSAQAMPVINPNEKKGGKGEVLVKCNAFKCHAFTLYLCDFKSIKNAADF